MEFEPPRWKSEGAFSSLTISEVKNCPTKTTILRLIGAPSSSLKGIWRWQSGIPP